MRRITGQKDSAHLPGIRRRRMKLVHRGTSNFIIVTRCPWIEQRLNLFWTQHLLSGLALEELKLPASIRILHTDIRREAFWIADLHRDERKIRGGTLNDVYDEPVLVVAKTFSCNSEVLSNKARSTITSNGIRNRVVGPSPVVEAETL